MRLDNLNEKEKEFVNTISYLGTIYNKSFTEQDLTVWYDILKEYPDEVLVKAIKEIAKTEKFMPTPATVIEMCNKFKELDRFEVLEYMRYKNYFKNAEEYLKAHTWLQTGVIPEWFKTEIKKYHDMLLNDDKEYIEAQQEPTVYIKAHEKPKVITTQPLRIEMEEEE